MFLILYSKDKFFINSIKKSDFLLYKNKTLFYTSLWIEKFMPPTERHFLG